jgi:hypothetical protein
MTHRKQHLIAETYLKYFSPNDDGKAIKVLHLNNKYKLNIECKNSGDSVFWKPFFYNTSEFNDPKTLEIFFGENIENGYNKLIRKLIDESNIIENEFRILIFQWVFYSKLRSPMMRLYFQQILSEKGIDFDFESKELREEHLQIFSNRDLFKKVLSYYHDNLIYKKWKILISPEEYSWITSDNPGFCFNLSEYKRDTKNYKPNPLWTNIIGDTLLYFPLTKRFCLKIEPYQQNDDVKLNFENDKTTFEHSNVQEYNLINGWTTMTANNILISCDSKELEVFEKIINCT